MRKTRATSAQEEVNKNPPKPEDLFEFKFGSETACISRQIFYKNIGSHAQNVMEQWNTGRKISFADIRDLVEACEKDKKQAFSNSDKHEGLFPPNVTKLVYGIAPEYAPPKPPPITHPLDTSPASTGSAQLLNPQLIAPHDPLEGTSGKRKDPPTPETSDDESRYASRDATSGSLPKLGHPQMSSTQISGNFGQLQTRIEKVTNNFHHAKVPEDFSIGTYKQNHIMNYLQDKPVVVDMGGYSNFFPFRSDDEPFVWNRLFRPVSADKRKKILGPTHCLPRNPRNPH